MIRTMKRQWILLVMLGSLLLSPLTALAAKSDETETDSDARQMGYKAATPLPDAGAAAAWSFWILMGMISIGVLFKSGKRSHLD